MLSAAETEGVLVTRPQKAATSNAVVGTLSLILAGSVVAPEQMPNVSSKRTLVYVAARDPRMPQTIYK